MASNINIIPSQELDKAKWDDCIYKSQNGLIYATSVYLDAMANKWNAMVFDEFEYVMPLPVRKKWLINYVYPPAFIQQLGIFSRNNIPAEIEKLFIESIPSKYKYCELNMNYANSTPGVNATKRKNYLLNLSYSYEQLNRAYSRSAKRNIQKAYNNNIYIQENTNPEDIIQTHRQRFNDRIGAGEADYNKFIILSKLLFNQGQCFTLGAYNNQNELIAGSIYFLYKNRLTFILNGNTPESLSNGATHLLKDYAINKFAGKDMVLDFEGSDFPSFARFYEQFGAKEIEYYATFVINRLPPLIRLLKR